MKPRKNKTEAVQDAALVVTIPKEPVLLTPPDTEAILAEYTTEILPMEAYAIADNAQYIQGTIDWTKARSFAAKIDELFEKPVRLAFQTHRSLTGLREQLKAPAVRIADHIGAQILQFRNTQDRIRREEETRRQAEEDLHREEERRRLQMAADRERQMAEEARQAMLAALEPWELDDIAAAEAAPAPVVIVMPEPVPVRLASTVPTVIGGPRVADLPWAAHVTDPVALLTWILADPGNRLGYIEFRMPALNSKARELGAELKNVIPGVEARREETLKRA